MTRSSRPATHDDDFFAWTQEQAATLRRLPPAAIGSAIDIAQVAEEIEDLGKRDLREVKSYLRRVFEHLIKIDACPRSADVPHWRGEARRFRDSARDAFSPGMRRLLDVAPIWRAGRTYAEDYLIHIGATRSPPLDCPFSLDELLADDCDLDAALATCRRDDRAAVGMALIALGQAATRQRSARGPRINDDPP